jgi:quercetin dioxygenase-like cupin family protein
MINPFILKNGPVGNGGVASLLDLVVLGAAVHRQSMRTLAVFSPPSVRARPIEVKLVMAKTGDVYHVFTNTITIKVAGADNDGALAMFVEEVPAMAGVPMHIHKGATETLFVLKGRYKISVADQVRELSEGDGVYLPADVPHAYTNIDSQRGQLLFTIYPSGLEGFFEEISQSGLDPATQLPDINRIAAKYQLEIVGPPLE